MTDTELLDKLEHAVMHFDRTDMSSRREEITFYFDLNQYRICNGWQDLIGKGVTLRDAIEGMTK